MHRTKFVNIEGTKVIVFSHARVSKFHLSIFGGKLSVFCMEVSRSYVSLLVLCAKGVHVPQQLTY